MNLDLKYDPCAPRNSPLQASHHAALGFSFHLQKGCTKRCTKWRATLYLFPYLNPNVHFDLGILCLTVNHESGKVVVNLDSHSFLPSRSVFVPKSCNGDSLLAEIIGYVNYSPLTAQHDLLGFQNTCSSPESKFGWKVITTA